MTSLAPPSLAAVARRRWARARAVGAAARAALVLLVITACADAPAAPVEIDGQPADLQGSIAAVTVNGPQTATVLVHELRRPASGYARIQLSIGAVPLTWVDAAGQVRPATVSDLVVGQPIAALSTGTELRSDPPIWGVRAVRLGPWLEH